MELSGLIFVALALVWAVVLIPKALKHHDDLAATRSVDTVSDAMRVLARREADGQGEPRLVVNPETGAVTGTVTVARGQVATPDRPRLQARRRRAAAAAARRRRRVLVALLVITASIGGATAAGLLAPWVPGVPAALVLGFLVVARVTVRRESSRWEALLAEAARTARPLPAEVVEDAGRSPEGPGDTLEMAALDGPLVALETRAGDGPSTPVVAGLDDTQAFPVGLLEQVEPTTDSASLWDPLPVTLPTYVGKPRATRSVRTIDLNAPDVASAGRDAAASALVAEAATANASDGPGQEAVNS